MGTQVTWETKMSRLEFVTFVAISDDFSAWIDVTD